MVDLKKVDRWIAEIESGRGMEFGYCEPCGGLTPATAVNAGRGGVYAECGKCGRSTQERFPAARYTIEGDIPRKFGAELDRDSDPLLQREFLRKMLTQYMVELGHEAERLKKERGKAVKDMKRAADLLSRLA